MFSSSPSRTRNASPFPFSFNRHKSDPLSSDRARGVMFAEGDEWVVEVARVRAERESRTYRTRSGRVLTDADIEALADEAERGYDVEHLLRKRDAMR